MVVFTFSVLDRKHLFLLLLRPYSNRDSEIGSYRLHGDECVRGLFFSTALNKLK